MRLAKACAIFMNIGSKDYSIEEKGAAIQMVCDMPTHNGITKDRMLDVIRWFLNLLFVTGVKAERSNADRIRAMSDEELANFVASKIVNIENQKMLEQGHIPTATQLRALGATMHATLIMWLKQPAEEGSKL